MKIGMRCQKQVWSYYVSTTECAELINVSYWTVRQLILTKKLEAVKINGRWKIPLSAVEALIHSSSGECMQETLKQTSSTECSEYLQMEKENADD